MATPLKVLLISSIVPDEAAMGGHLILKRHFDNPNFDCHVFKPTKQPNGPGRFSRLKQIKLRKVARTLECLYPQLLDEEEIDLVISDFNPDVILSVAHGWSFFSAANAARRRKLPLVLWCQDWWPDFLDAPRPVREFVGRKVRAVCRQAKKIICVSEGMHEEIGSLPSSRVLHDLPSTVEPGPTRCGSGTSFQLIYGGNVWVYGDLISAAAIECLQTENLRLEIYGGPGPRWSGEVAEKLRIAGFYHGLVTPAAFLERVRGCDAVLVMMSFDPKLARRMKTSFLSKLIEMAQLRLPIVIWGPEYCSAVQWARQRNAALCVTVPCPKTLRLAIEGLAASESEQRRLSAAAGDAADREFNPERIRNEFFTILNEATVESSH